MSPRERILAAVRRQSVDHVPCCIIFNPLTAAQRVGHDWQFPWPANAPLADQLQYQVEELGLDQVVSVGLDLARPEPGVTARTWVDEGVLHKAWETPAGELHAAVRSSAAWPHGEDIPFFSDFNVGHFVTPWIESEADLARLRHVRAWPRRAADLEAVQATIARQRALADRWQLACQAHVGSGLTGAQQLFGAEALCLATIDQPDLVDAYLEDEHQLNLRTIELLADSGVDLVRRNGFYETADFYHPAMLERFLGRRLRAEAAAAHAAGLPVSYTVHTGVMPLLDYLAGLPLDSLFGIDLFFHGVDATAIRDRLGAGKSLWVGPSSTFHLWRGPQATREAVREVFEVCGSTGWILSPAVSAHSIMPWASTVALVEQWRASRG